jgi:hypothetical protein
MAGLSLAMVGCGDSDDGMMDDVTNCGGHGQPACAGSPWALAKEGGLARAELVIYIDGSQTLGIFAYFFNKQTPDLQALDGTNIQVQGMTCQDMRSGLVYDTGAWPQGQAINDTRTYLDMGPTVTYDNKGTGADYVLEKHTDVIDGSNFLAHKILYATSTVGVTVEDVAALQTPGTYELKFSGSNWSDADLKDGDSKGKKDGKSIRVNNHNMYMPASWTAITPPENADITLHNGQDWTLTWSNGVESAENPGILNFIGFGDATVGALDFFCVVDDQPDLETFTVPGSLID